MFFPDHKRRVILYTLIHHLPVRRLILDQAPVLGVSLVLAEWFYRLHSFTLECAAFLVTWFALDLIRVWIMGRFAGRSPEPAD